MNNVIEYNEYNEYNKNSDHNEQNIDNKKINGDKYNGDKRNDKIKSKHVMNELYNIQKYKLSQSSISGNKIIDYINIKYSDNKSNNKYIPYVNKSLYLYLKKAKLLIENNLEQWDTVKKYTNPYEFIHTNYQSGRYISKLKPLSRAYYKMVEIINEFNILSNFNYKNINTFHLAEGPGGFIEAFLNLRNNKKDTYYGMTLDNNNDKNIPGWNKSKYFLSKNMNVILEKGISNDGDLYNPDNLEHCYLKYKHSIDIITGDGGFDFSVDFQKQEIMAFNLILSQVFYALVMQSKGGHFILKVFDIFMKPTVDILYILNCFYKEVYIYKPKTSRYANSEKYIICKGFKGIHTLTCLKIINLFCSIKEGRSSCRCSCRCSCSSFDVSKNNIYNRGLLDVEMTEHTEHAEHTEHTEHAEHMKDGNKNKDKNKDKCSINYMSSILDTKLPLLFISCIQEINSIYGQQQLENIMNTIIMINKNNLKYEKMEKIKKENIELCIEWCKKYNIDFHEYKKNNVFSSSTYKKSSF